MNRRDLKLLRIDESYILTPHKLLMILGVSNSSNSQRITDNDLNYILQGILHHASVKNICADKVYRGEIVLVGTPNNFNPYYRPKNFNIHKSMDNLEHEDLEDNKLKSLRKLRKDIDLNQEDIEPTIQKVYRLD